MFSLELGIAAAVFRSENDASFPSLPMPVLYAHQHMLSIKHALQQMSFRQARERQPTPANRIKNCGSENGKRNVQAPKAQQTRLRERKPRAH
jgi:hypothetical protein